jgi:DMSO/TMAO reductase YedYZ molybdopterin-dependent catalytic subunit
MENELMNGAQPYLTTRSLIPENQESPIHFIHSPTVSNELFYRRNHFTYPKLFSISYFLPIAGAVQTPLLFFLEQITNMPSKRLKVVLECAGDKRSFFEPQVYGEQWEKGAISQGYWKGVPLRTFLQYTGISGDAKEVVFEGYDNGKRKDIDSFFHYARSLPIEVALHPDTIIAYEYNDKPIPFKHGYPFRLVVPGWYAMASIKWVKQITVINKEFTGPFQSIDYVYYPFGDNDSGKFPVTWMNVNSTIQQPLNWSTLEAGKHTVMGIAWTGRGRISKVEISFDYGETWQPAQMNYSEPYSWVQWKYEWEAIVRGEYTIMSRATDSAGRVQPKEPFWNRKGYGYNATDKIRVEVV